VHGDGIEGEERVLPDPQREWHHLVHRHAELDPALPGRDEGMGVGGDVGVDPNAHSHRPAAALHDPAQRRELGGGFQVHVADARLDRRNQLVIALPDPAEDDPLRLEAGGERPRQLAAGDDVGAGAQVPKDPEHREIGVRLDGVGHPVRHRVERPVERAKLPSDHAGAVEVRRRPHGLGDRGERHAAEVERTAPALETGVGVQRRVGGRGGAQYALAHRASVTVGRPHHMHVEGTCGERNSSSGRTRIVALVCSLISISHSVRPQKPE
jgi:hypothetical protein